MGGAVHSARAHWVSRDCIAWEAASSGALSYRLHFGFQAVDLTRDAAGLPQPIKEKFPHLSHLPVLRVPPGLEVRHAVREPILVTAGELASSLQIPGVLDDLFAYDGPLGVSFENGVPVLRLWAPTARSVTVLFDYERIPMTFDERTGVWSVSGNPDWNGRFYTYQVEVFVRTTGRIEWNVVTDPYSFSLSTNSRRSQIVNLADSSLKPEGWDSLAKPPLAKPEDAVIYELHLRDFSMSDPRVPPEHRGTYLAFTHPDSYGMRHLSEHARAGLTHIHFLPLFDFATVNDLRGEHLDPGDLTGFPPDSEEQQARVERVKDRDGYNWGYDPFHYTVPEGSYSTSPEGPARIREFRQMVKALADAGLRIVMDVVYNHTHSSGQAEKSVLDRIVPGYYHRLNANGEIETSTCCANTATEHLMMEKLMIDSLVTWASEYKVDGFRFDLMGHHMKANILKARDRVRKIDPAVLLYGEGWSFGEVANNARGVNASQLNMAGTGVATFSDRLRDAARGGGPFSGLQEQGFVTGLAEDPHQGERFRYLSDIVRVALAGSLGEVRIGSRRAAEIEFRGQPAGYTTDPQETVNYVAAHDNETLFDAIQLKARDAPLNERVRMNNLALSLVMLAQGIPLFHAGDEMLRSKSLDRNSYNSGDWFNRLDFTLQSNAFGSGLPPAAENRQQWDIFRPLLANHSLKARRTDIDQAVHHFRELLRIRKSTPLLRLPDAGAVLRSFRFYDSLPGVVVFSVSEAAEGVAVVINAYRADQNVKVSALVGARLTLHPAQQGSADPVLLRAGFDAATGLFSIPGRTAAVFLGQIPAA